MAIVSAPILHKMAFLLGLSIIGAVCYLASTFDTFPGDVEGLKRFQDLRSGWLDDAAKASSSKGQLLAVAISIPVIALALLWRGRRADSIAVLLLWIPNMIVWKVVKELVDRPRPEFSLFDPPGSPSFPSGHAVHAFILLGLLIPIVEEMVTPIWPRRILQGLLVSGALVCGASRVYLGVHWPSDVLGGFLVGGFSLIAILWARKKLIQRGLQ